MCVLFIRKDVWPNCDIEPQLGNVVIFVGGRGFLFEHVIAVCCGPHILPYLAVMQVATSYNRNLNQKVIAAFLAQSYPSTIPS